MTVRPATAASASDGSSSASSDAARTATGPAPGGRALSALGRYGTGMMRVGAIPSGGSGSA